VHPIGRDARFGPTCGQRLDYREVKHQGSHMSSSWLAHAKLRLSLPMNFPSSELAVVVRTPRLQVVPWGAGSPFFTVSGPI
jgi:hypothetical protein